MSKQLYKVPLPDVTRTDDADTLGTQLSEQAELRGDAIVDALSSEAADLSLRGEIALGAFYSQLVATELEELADSSIQAVPLFDAGDEPAADIRDGYYEIASATVEPVHGAARDVWQYDVDLTKIGTRKSHLRAVRTAPVDPDPGSPYNSTADDLVAVPTDAQQLEAVDAVTGPSTRQSLSVLTTLETAHGAVDVIELDETPIDDPIVTFDLPYQRDAPTAARVYDTLDREGKFIEGDNGRVRQWETVFTTTHEWSPSAEAVISNGLVRLRIDEPDDGDMSATFAAERYSSASGAWESISLPTTAFEIADVDLRRIGPQRVTAILTFEDGTDIERVLTHLDRGAPHPIMRPVAGSLPSDLEDHLEPVAENRADEDDNLSVADVQPRQTLVERSEVRPQ